MTMILISIGVAAASVGGAWVYGKIVKARAEKKAEERVNEVIAHYNEEAAKLAKKYAGRQKRREKAAETRKKIDAVDSWEDFDEVEDSIYDSY